MKIYKSILKFNDLCKIQKILNYEFKFPGLIEKAVIHPSSNENILGSVYFNKLELLGDCALDLVVTEHIFYKYQSFNPEKLHCKRKSLVNNFSLARVLFTTGLIKHIQICYDKKHIEDVLNKLKIDGQSVNKSFGDVFESICGAILVDMEYSFESFKKYAMDNLFSFLETCADETR
ncbi:helicase-like protein [Gurleya vavrai]